jgi:tetratricopeptide (TPR) repeat protein
MNPFKKTAKSSHDDDEPEFDRINPFGILLQILMLPIHALFLPFKALGIFHDSGVDIGRHQNLTKGEVFRLWCGQRWRGIRIAVVAIFSLPLTIARRVARNPRDLVFILPALIMIGLIGFVYFRVFVQSDQVERQYRIGIQTALTNQDFPRAKSYFERLMESKELTAEEQFQWAIVLSKTENIEQAETILNKLAPDDKTGLEIAHRAKAVNFSRQIGRNKSPDLLTKLKHHLDRAGTPTPEIHQAWAQFFIASEQYDDAVGSLKKIAIHNPNIYIWIAQIEQVNGNPNERIMALKNAKEKFREILETDPLKSDTRIAFANVLSQLEEFDESEQVLRQGLRIQPDIKIRNATADFFVMRHDLAIKDNENTAKQLKYLVDAITFNPNFPPVYSRMVAMFMNGQRSPEEANRIRKTLQDIVASDNPNSLAHFALSNVLWQDGNFKDANFYLEQAYKMDPNIVVIQNNLAWMLAHAKEPDLTRALELAESAVAQSPKDARFRDTLGTILFKLERYDEAVTELKLALAGVSDKKAVHQKLAITYNELGMEEMAERHSKQTTE